MKKNFSSKTNKKPKAQNIGISFSFLLTHLFVATSEEVKQIAGIAEQQSWHEFNSLKQFTWLQLQNLQYMATSKQASNHAHACVQCSPASVGLAQV